MGEIRKVEKFADLFIWGAGENGRRIFPHIGSENVIAFIDNNSQKIGGYFCDRPVISYETYKEKYKDYFIVISPLESKQIEEKLLGDNIISFFKQCNCPSEFSEPEPRQILKQCILSEIKEDKSVVIYGKSLYSIILNHWIKEVKERYVDIIIPQGTDRAFFDLLKKSFPNMNFLTEEEGIEEIRSNGLKVYVSDR